MRNTKSNRSYIKKVGMSIRRVMLDPYYSDNWKDTLQNGCFTASKVLSDILDCDFVSGEMIVKLKDAPQELNELRMNGPHAWVEMGNKIIDITGSQYNDIAPGEFSDVHILATNKAYNSRNKYVYIPIMYNDFAYDFNCKFSGTNINQYLINEITEKVVRLI